MSNLFETLLNNITNTVDVSGVKRDTYGYVTEYLVLHDPWSLNLKQGEVVKFEDHMSRRGIVLCTTAGLVCLSERFRGRSCYRYDGPKALAVLLCCQSGVGYHHFETLMNGSDGSNNKHYFNRTLHELNEATRTFESNQDPQLQLA